MSIFIMFCELIVTYIMGYTLSRLLYKFYDIDIWPIACMVFILTIGTIFTIIKKKKTKTKIINIEEFKNDFNKKKYTRFLDMSGIITICLITLYYI